MAQPSKSSRPPRRKPTAPTPRHPLLLWIAAHETLAFLLASSVLVFALYGQALGAPFVYDDLDQIVNNTALGSWPAFAHRFLLAPVAFTSDFRGPGGLSYRPLYWLTLALDRHLWGLNPTGFHLTNLLLHLLNGLLAFRLLRRLRVSLLVAASATLLWLALPINTEVVSWISARAYSLATALLLLALLAAERYLRSRHLLTLAAFFLLALAAPLAHEQGLLLLPLTALVALAIPATKFATPNPKPTPPPGRHSEEQSDQDSRRLQPPHRRPNLSASKLATLTLAALLAVAIDLALKHRIIPHPQAGPASPQAFGLFFAKYLAWILLPIHMSVERSTSTPPSALTPTAVLAAIAVAALLALTLFLRKKLPATAAGILWLFLALAPFCGLVFIYQGMAERFTYLASLGLALTLAAIALHPRLRRFALAPILLWTLWGAVRLTTRVADWTDPVRLYRNSLRATPNSPTLLYNTAFALRERGDLAEAETYYRHATELQPRYQRAFSSLGELLGREGKRPESEAAYRQALLLDPNDAGTTLDLAVLLQQAGSPAAAEQTYRRAISLAPTDSAAYTDLGTLLFEQGRTPEAAAILEQAISHRPTDPTPYFNLAVLYQGSGRADLALPLYRRVLELKPGDPDTLQNMQRLQQPR